MPPIDFTDVEEPKGAELLPAGTYRGVITDAEEREVKSGDFAGNQAFNLEITMSECINNPDLECDGRKVWDFIPVIPPHEKKGKKNPGTFGRIKQVARVTDLDTDKPLDFDDVDGDDTTFVEYLNGRDVIVKIKARKGQVNKETGDTYADKNTVSSYHTEEEFEDKLS